MRAIAAEFLKVTSVRLWWILLAILVVYVALTAGLLAAAFGALADSFGASGGNVPSIPDARLPGVVYSSAVTFGYVIPVLFGALATTNEFRYQTISPSFLAEPRRTVVLGAKLVVLGGCGAAFGVAAVSAAVAAGGGVLAAAGIDPGLGESATWALLARAVVAMALWGAIGVALGALIPSQVAAIVILLAFTQFVEPLLRIGASVWDWTARVGAYLPGAASDALVGASVFSSLSPTGAPGTSATVILDWWQGALVLFSLATVFSIGGYLTTWRRDVT